VVLLHHALKLPTLRLRQPLTQCARHVRLHMRTSSSSSFSPAKCAIK
jgi:hypothetical protein